MLNPKIISLIMAACIFASDACADDGIGPLAPGKPAGVKEAQDRGPDVVVFIGVTALLVFAGYYLASHGGSSNKPSGVSNSAPAH